MLHCAGFISAHSLYMFRESGAHHQEYLKTGTAATGTCVMVAGGSSHHHIRDETAERRVLGYIYIRRGPNKVRFIGLFQPFGNAIKLFTREQYFPLVSNYFIYYFSPIFGFSFLCWFGY